MIPRILAALIISITTAIAQSGGALEIPAPPPEQGTISLLLLTLVLSFVCLPLSLLAFVIVLLVLVKVLGLFKITPARMVAALVQSGGVGMLKMLLWPLGLLITVPGALLAAGWAARMLDRRLDLGDRMVFGCAAGVLVAVALLAIVKRLARAVKQRMLGGKMPGGMKQAKPAGRAKRR